jgi:valyl-tRNA synthetase
LRAELKVEPKVRVPVEMFSHDPETWNLVQNNREAIKRLASVQTIDDVTEQRARQAPSRSTTRFDVRVVYEKKIDVAAERERLTKELEKIEKQLVSAQARLGDERFLRKAPPHVVEGLRKQVEEATILRDKNLAKLKELG